MGGPWGRAATGVAAFSQAKAGWSGAGAPWGHARGWGPGRWTWAAAAAMALGCALALRDGRSGSTGAARGDPGRRRAYPRPPLPRAHCPWRGPRSPGAFALATQAHSGAQAGRMSRCGGERTGDRRGLRRGPAARRSVGGMARPNPGGRTGVVAAAATPTNGHHACGPGIEHGGPLADAPGARTHPAVRHG